MFSAYDIKKILPRAVFALVAASLSWSLMDVIIDFVNATGDSAYSLILGAFPAEAQGLVLGAASANSLAAVIVAGGAGAALGLLPVAGVAIAGITGILLAFAIILIRRIVLVFMVIIAPLAIVASIFPQTENLFKKWWDWFFKLLLMYPFIMAMFAVSKAVAYIMSQYGQSGGSGVAVIYQLAAVALLILPYFFIGKALSFAGGSIAKVAGFVNNKDKGLIDRTKKWDATRVNKNRSDSRGGSRYQDRFGTRTLNRGLRRVMNPGSLNPTSAARRQAALGAGAAGAIGNLEELEPAIKTLTKDEADILARAQGSAAEGRRAIALKADQARNRAEQEYRDRQLAAGAAVDPDEVERVRREAGQEAQQQWSLHLASASRKAGGLSSASSAYAFGKANEQGAFALDMQDPGSAAEIERISRDLGIAVAGTGRAGVNTGAGFEGGARKGQAASGNLVTANLGEGRSVAQAASQAAQRASLEDLAKQSHESSQQMANAFAQQIQDAQVAMQAALAAGDTATAQGHLNDIVAARGHLETMRVAAAQHGGSQRNQDNVAAAVTQAQAALDQAEADVTAANAFAGMAGAAPVLNLDNGTIADTATTNSRRRTGGTSQP